MKPLSLYLLLLISLLNQTIYSFEHKRVPSGIYAIPLSGTYTIPGDFATINDAAISLNANGISGPVVFNVAANHTETAPAGTSAVLTGGILFGNISGTSAINTITFQKNGSGANPLVTAGSNHFAGGIMDAVIKIVGCDYLTFDKIDVSENPSNTTFSPITSNNMTEFGYAFFYANPAATANGAQNNTIKNCVINLNSVGTNYPNTFGIFSTTASSATNGLSSSSVTAIAGSNSNNKLYGNTINNANFGIVVIGSNTPAAMDIGWDIGGTTIATGNTITNFAFGNGTASSAYQKLGTSVQGILMNQVADHNVSYNTISSTNGSTTTTIVLSGIVLGWNGVLVQPQTNTSTCNYNSISINNGLSDSTYGIWSRMGNATSSRTINYNSITLQNSATIAVAGKFMRGIYQDSAIGELITSNNIISLHYENADHAHGVYFIQADVATALNRVANTNTLQTPIGKTLRTSGIAIGISHSGLSTGSLLISGNTLSIDKGNVSSTAVFSGIYSNGVSSATTSYTISQNTISLKAEATTNATTTITGINNSDGTATTDKTIFSNTITITGTNIGGFSYGILMGRSGIINVNLNDITINNFSTTMNGIFLTTGCTTNNLSSNKITISPTGIPSTTTIIGINNVIGTPNISQSDITIAPTIVPLATTTLTIQGITNAVANGVITNSTKILIAPISIENTIVVNFTTNGIFNSGANGLISDNSNIQINSSTLSGAATTNGINNSGATGTVISGNTNISTTINANTATTVQGITNSGSSATIQNNTNLHTDLTTSVGNASINTINNSGVGSSILGNQNIVATANATVGATRIYGINNTATTVNITNNSNFTITGNATSNSTSVRGISSSVSCSITNNTVIASNSNAGTTSSTYGIYGMGDISNNSITASSFSQTGIDISAGIQSESNTTINNNTITTNFIAASGSVIAYGINSNNTNCIISNNTINHSAVSNGNQIALAWFAMIYGIRSYGINTIIENNHIDSVYGSMGKGTTIYEIAGILLDTAENAIISGNVISNVSSNGTADNRTYLSGIYALTGSNNVTIKNNRIFNISFNNSVTGVHPGPGIETGQPIPANTNGIWVRLSFNTILNEYKIYNNHISKLYNPSASSLGGIFGLTLSSREVNYTVYHNTILIGDNSTLVTSNIVGNFGGTAVGYLNRVGTGMTDLRNNILYVNLMPKGSGYVSALAAIKNHDLDLGTFFVNPGQTGVRPPNYSPTSNNNLFYAPSVHGRRSYFYCEGNGFGTEYNRFNIDHNTAAINDPNMNVTAFTGCTSNYKTLMNGGFNNYGTDSNSFYDNVTLIEGTGIDEGYWTPSGETFAESGAQVLGATYDLDSKNVSRGSSPDIGALQFSGIIPVAPVITYGPIIIPGSCGAIVSSLNLDNVHITDDAGVPTTGTLVPRLYYKVNSGGYTSVAGTLTSGNGYDGYWSFTLTGLSAGTISYYVIAQDRLTKIISNPSAGLLACNVNNVTTHPTSPSTLTMGGSVAIYSSGAWSSPPTISKAVIFDDDYSSTVNIEACSVLVKAGRTVVFNSANTLLVQNEVVVEPTGNLTFENNSSLVQIANVSNTGDISYKRIANVKKYDFVYWSSPVNGFNLDNLNLLQPTGPKYKWETTLANSNGGLGNWVVANSNTMETSRGYIVRSPLIYNIAVASPFLATFTGVPNNGVISYPISRGAMTAATLGSYTSANGIPFTIHDDNWSLVGNPYPSAISANHLLYQNRETAGGYLAGYIKIWQHGIDIQAGINNPFYGSYIYNYDPNDYLTYNIIGASCCPAINDYKIGAGQGFFVEMIEGDAATGTIDFSNDMRRDLSNVIHDNTLFFKNNNTTYPPNLERHRIWLDIVNSENKSARTLIGYINGATDDYDSFFDVPYGYNQTLDVYSLVENQHSIIQGRALPFTIYDEVPVGYYCPQAGNYTFALAAVDGLFVTQNIYIKDLLLDITHNLKESPYVFSSEIGRFNDRFVLVYQNNELSSSEYQTENNIKVYKNHHTIGIKSTPKPIEKIDIFDVSGRLLYSQNEVNKNEILLSDISSTNQVLLIQIKTIDGIITIKKIIY